MRVSSWAALIFVVGCGDSATDVRGVDAAGAGDRAPAADAVVRPDASSGLDASVVDGASSTDAGAGGADAATEPAFYQHVGPITTTTVAALEAPWFAEVSPTAGFVDVGPDSRAMLVDVNGDGHDDLFTVPVTSTPLRPRLFRNRAGDGGFGFDDITADSGLAEAEMTLAVFGDVDGDGDADLVALTGVRSRQGEDGVWLNDGRGRFTFAGTRGLLPSLIRVSLAGRVHHEPAAVALVDLDGDADLDLYVGHFYAQILRSDGAIGQTDPTLDRFYENLGDGSFRPVELPAQLNPLTASEPPDENPETTGRAAYGLAMADYDDDGDVDLFVHNYGAGRPALGSPPRYWDHNLLWRNDGELQLVDVGAELGVSATLRGTVTDRFDPRSLIENEPPLDFGGRRWPVPIGGNGFGCSFGDFDNDGDFDLITPTIGHPDYLQSDRTLLFVNPGDGTAFAEESRVRGLEWAEDEIHAAWVDVDQDGRLDLAVSRLRGGTKLELYRQGDDQVFVRQAQATTGIDIARPGPTLWTDLDGDGDLDFFMPGGRFRTEANPSRWRVFRNDAGVGRWLRVRLEGRTLRDAVGAKVRLRTSVGSQIRQVVGGEGHYNTQPSRWLHFGLGGDTGAADVTIDWPDGEVQSLGDVRANQALVVEQGGTIRAAFVP